MFCDNSPVWRFLSNLGAQESPEGARTAESGLHLMEVFPALALPSLEPAFCTRLGAPKYNPGRKKAFRREHWRQVAEVTARQFRDLGFSDAANWCDDVVPRLDVHNGLLLSSLWDAAFDSGLISFNDDGTVLVSNLLSPSARRELGAEAARPLVLAEPTRIRMEWHRKNEFKAG